MNNLENLKLIDGSFSASEAKEILTTLFSNKIQFHTTKNFSTEVRFGKDDEVSSKRIPELNQSLEKILNLITQAQENNQTFEIQSEVNIRLITNK
ncbi:hypothetical protein SLW70_10700 [Flavobacterium sp. NG2]|uniref:hypothetical protein n=1 Tax=Flavobacterium sp. NG2 TaxID=3097547 RepID=UPI002A7F1CB5|nr:hypothetical protein [Flavobacterium sp. NG2]WPR70410.1 hypothetical protein SLW70_10700 [Flavobacterium sp. NG2]